MMALNQIDGQGVRPQVNPLVSLGIGGEGALNLPAGCIFGVQDSFAGMAAFFHEGKIAVTVFFEANAKGDQILNSLGGFRDDAPDHGFVALAVTASQGVLDMGLHRFGVCFVQDGGDTALGPVR